MGVLHNKRTLVFEHNDVFKKLSMKAQIYILNLSPDHEFLDYGNVVLNSKRWLQDGSYDKWLIEKSNGVFEAEKWVRFPCIVESGLIWIKWLLIVIDMVIRIKKWSWIDGERRVLDNE